MLKSTPEKILSVILIVTMSFSQFSCKKKEKTSSEPAAQTTTGGTPADGSVSTASLFSGIFTTMLNTQITGTSVSTSTTAFVWFGSQPSIYIDYSRSVKVSELRLNGDTLWYYPFSKQYYSWYPVNLATEAWSVSGANGIPSFSINLNTTQPICSNYTVLLDSISKSAGFSINVNGVSNSTSAYFDINDGTNSNVGFVSVSLNNGNNVINIPSSSLANLVTGNSQARMSIDLYSDKAYVFGGKDFKFTRSSQYYKNIKIKN